MSDLINTITVVLEKDKRDDDCESILNAIRMIKGVLQVTTNEANPVTYMAETRARREIEERLLRALHPNPHDPLTPRY